MPRVWRACVFWRTCLSLQYLDVFEWFSFGRWRLFILKKNYENRVDIGLYIRNKILLECAKQHKNHTKHPELKDITIKQSVLIFRSPWTIKVFHWLRNSTWLTVLQSTKIVIQTCITIIHHDLLSCQLPINTSDRAKIHLLQSCKCDVTLEAIVIL